MKNLHVVAIVLALGALSFGMLKNEAMVTIFIAVALVSVIIQMALEAKD